MKLYKPIDSVTIATSTVSAVTALPAATDSVRLLNNSASLCWVEFSANPALVAAIPSNGTVKAGVMLAPGATEAFRINSGVTHLSAILPAGASASTLHINAGEGI